MGKFSKGIFGNFYGKIGQVIGSSWRGIDYMKSLPKINKNRKPTEPQLEQQKRFGMMTAFLNPIRDLFEIGYRNAASTATTYNHALAENVTTALSGIYPALAIEYSLVQLSRGTMATGGSPALSAAASCELQFSWINNAGKGKALGTDLAIALVHCPELNESEYSIGEATRGDEALNITLPAEYAGKLVETWIFWASATRKEVTATVYTGSVTVLD